MDLPSRQDVDDRLADLLAAFPPAEVLARQRAEDLVAAALTMYGGAFRRARELAEEHHLSDIARDWSTREPLAGLLALHRADSPAPPPVEVDEVRHASGTIDAILDDLDDETIAISDPTVEMLAIVTDLHAAGLAQLMGEVDGSHRPPAPLVQALARDHLVASVLLVHGLHPEPLDQRLARTLADIDGRSGAVASVELVELTDLGAHLRVEGASPNDAYRLRLDLERALAERVPDLVVARIDGGEEPVQPTSVFIPIESLTVRRNPATQVRT